MFVAYDESIPPPREHPWTIGSSNPEFRYSDFKTEPDKIPLVLEDFAPWAHYDAIQRYYEFLRWLNGPESAFESNDSGLRPPRIDHDLPDVIRFAFDCEPTVVHGRLAFMFRDLVWNCSRPTIDGLKGSIHDALRNDIPDIPAVIKIGEWAHLFTRIGREGHVITITFWAWGNDESGAMARLHNVFDILHGCLKWASDGITAQRANPKAGTPQSAR